MLVINDALCAEYSAAIEKAHGPNPVLTPVEHAHHAAAFLHHKDVTDDAPPTLTEAMHREDKGDRLLRFLHMFALWRLKNLSIELEVERSENKNALPINRSAAQ